MEAKGSTIKGPTAYFEPNLPIQVQHCLVHCRQRYDWDCGITCIMMILRRYKRQHLLHNFNTICIEEGFACSTWTIDLCYLLKRYGIQHIYTTTTIGINPNLRDNQYFGPILWHDQVRVRERFSSAAEMGINIQQKAVDNVELLRHLAFNGPIIALVNNNLLCCEECHGERAGVLNEIGNGFAKRPNQFCGHYIVLCGYDNRNGCIFYRNPGCDDHLCVISYEKLTDSRCCEETDNDLIFIFSKSSN